MNSGVEDAAVVPAQAQFRKLRLSREHVGSELQNMNEGYGPTMFISH
jgi:hypothetical protein